MENEDLYLHIRQTLHADYSNLLTNFTKTPTVRFQYFAEKWREMRMSLIFYGHSSEPELRQFTEEAFEQVWSFLSPDSSLQVQIGAFYLLYSLYEKQLCNPKVKIRITLAHWKLLKELHSKMKEQAHTDFDYVFTRMKTECAFHFVTTQQQMFMYMKAGKTQSSEQTAGDQDSHMAELLEPDIIDHLSAIHEQYYQMKCSLAGDAEVHPSPSLSIVNLDLIQNITKCVTKYHDRCRNKDSWGSRSKRKDGMTSDSDFDSLSEAEQAMCESPGKTRARVRARAFAQSATLSRSRRHRNVQTEENAESDVKKKKQHSPMKSVCSDVKEQISDDSEKVDPEGRVLLNMPTLTGKETVAAAVEMSDSVDEEGPSDKRSRKKPPKKKSKKTISSKKAKKKNKQNRN